MNICRRNTQVRRPNQSLINYGSTRYRRKVLSKILFGGFRGERRGLTFLMIAIRMSTQSITRDINRSLSAAYYATFVWGFVEMNFNALSQQFISTFPFPFQDNK